VRLDSPPRHEGLQAALPLFLLAFLALACCLNFGNDIRFESVFFTSL
jgi:hypothetical protein